MTPRPPRAVARIEYLKVRNFRALREIEFKDIKPLTALLGPNGSGKSTVFDVFALLAECFELGLRRAWNNRGRAKELMTRSAEGPLSIEIKVHPFQGKDDLLGKLQARLRGYAQWLPLDWRILVLVDRDDEDCLALKERLEMIAASAGLLTPARAGTSPWQPVNRIACEELEAWYFGDWEAVRRAYPRVSPAIPGKQGLRDPDAIRGGTWEVFERVLKQHGYFATGLRKVETARTMATHLDPDRNRSRSFVRLREVIAEATA